jgi:hypothetical protein
MLVAKGELEVALIREHHLFPLLNSPEIIWGKRSLTNLLYRPARRKVFGLARKNFVRNKGTDPSTNSNLLQGRSFIFKKVITLKWPAPNLRADCIIFWQVNSIIRS